MGNKTSKPNKARSRRMSKVTSCSFTAFQFCTMRTADADSISQLNEAPGDSYTKTRPSKHSRRSGKGNSSEPDPDPDLDPDLEPPQIESGSKSTDIPAVEFPHSSAPETPTPTPPQRAAIHPDLGVQTTPAACILSRMPTPAASPTPASDVVTPGRTCTMLKLPAPPSPNPGGDQVISSPGERTPFPRASITEADRAALCKNIREITLQYYKFPGNHRNSVHLYTSSIDGPPKYYFWYSPYWEISKAPVCPAITTATNTGDAVELKQQQTNSEPQASGHQCNERSPYFDLSGQDQAIHRIFCPRLEPWVSDNELMMVPEEDEEYWATFYFTGLKAAREILKRRKGEGDQGRQEP